MSKIERREDVALSTLRRYIDELIPDGASTAARGSFSSATLDVGNCETGDFPGTLTLDDDGDGGTFTIVDLHEAPYCDGAAVAGALEGCFRYSDGG